LTQVQHIGDKNGSAPAKSEREKPGSSQSLKTRSVCKKPEEENRGRQRFYLLTTALPSDPSGHAAVPARKRAKLLMGDPLKGKAQLFCVWSILFSRSLLTFSSSESIRRLIFRLKS
jgi:hypothetical protein